MHSTSNICDQILDLKKNIFFAEKDLNVHFVSRLFLFLLRRYLRIREII